MKAIRSHFQVCTQCPVGIGCLLLLLLSQTTVRAQQSTTASPATQQNTTLELSATTESEASGDPVFVIDEECRVPAYASINYETMFSAPVTNDSLLVVEGQCYLACMESLSEPEAGFVEQQNRHTQYPSWPYYTLNERDCGVHQYVHECTRGCVINSNTPENCETECLSHCSNECGHSSIPLLLPTCNNSDSDEFWVWRNCPLTCDYPRCSAGCNIDKSVHCTPECRPPLTPTAPSTLTPVVNSTRAGMYTIDLTHTVPPSSLLQHNVVFLFEIQENTTGNYSYHWLVDPRTLDLADFSCREVTVRFAVANLNGLSGFSESVRIPQVYGVHEYITTIPEASGEAPTLEEEESEPTVLSVSEEIFTEDPLFVIDEECRIPDDASINYEFVFSAPITNDSLLFVEGQCYMACMESLSDPEVGYLDRRNRHTQFPPWPYYTLKEGDCGAHQYVHECTRGCVINSNTPGHCEIECLSHCSNECGHSSAPYPLPTCDNPDSDELWVRMNCPLTCDYPRCSAGCNIDKSVHCTPDCRPPLTPAAPPTLTPVVNTTSAGVYTIDLTHTVPPSDLLSHNVVFLFEILDNTTGNYSYHWLVDPRTTQLDLADFTCREVTVRFAVANLNGLSGFSESIRIPQVYGARKPNPVVNISVSQIDDTRVGYFGHVIWNITWDPPESQLRLEGYTVEVYNPNPKEFLHCGQRVWTQTLNINETSVTVFADHPDEVLVMGCNYIVEVHALGLEENESVALDLYADIFPSRPQFIHDLQCNRLWDLMEYKFFFNFTWSLPFYMAVEDPIEVYYISVELIRGGSNVPIASVRKNSRYVPPPNETSFKYSVPHEGQSFFLPQADSALRFRFKLSFLFNATNIRFPPESPALPTRQFTCTTDAISPPPSSVQHLSLNCFELLNSTTIISKISWVPPANPNGKLKSYSVCMSRNPLERTDEPYLSGDSVCDTINGTLREATASMSASFLSEENINFLYLQIRANNDFVSGAWTDAVVISIGESGQSEILCHSAVQESNWRIIVGAAIGCLVPLVVLLVFVAVLSWKFCRPGLKNKGEICKITLSDQATSLPTKSLNEVSEKEKEFENTYI